MMMCDVMPTIKEDSGGDHHSQGLNEDSNFDPLIANVFDERDQLAEQLQDVQNELLEANQKFKDLERERDALSRQLDSSYPLVCFD